MNSVINQACIKTSSFTDDRDEPEGRRVVAVATSFVLVKFVRRPAGLEIFRNAAAELTVCRQ